MHAQAYSNILYRPCDLGLSDEIQIRLKTKPRLDTMCIVLYLDEKENRIGHDYFPANVNCKKIAPEDTRYLKFGLRIAGGSHFCIEALHFGWEPISPNANLRSGKYLLVTDCLT